MVDVNTSTVDFYTAMPDLLRSIKYNLMRYATENGGVLSKVNSWNIGYVFPETVYPAIAVFPISKTFVSTKSDGSMSVEYRVSIDIHSAGKLKLVDSKAYTVEAAGAIQKAIKKSIRMIDKAGVSHSFETVVENQIFHESEDAQKRGLKSTASVLVVCRALHEMNADRIVERTIQEQDFDGFIDTLADLVKAEASIRNYGVKHWSTKIGEPALAYPAVAILPGNEDVGEERTNQIVILERPIQVYATTYGIPAWPALRKNIILGDNLVTILEMYQMVSGYAQEFAISNIDYHPDESGMMFSSVINVTYRSRSTLQTRYA